MNAYMAEEIIAEEKKIKCCEQMFLSCIVQYFTGEIKQVPSGIIQTRDKTQIIKAYIYLHNKWVSDCVSTMYSSYFIILL